MKPREMLDTIQEFPEAIYISLRGLLDTCLQHGIVKLDGVTTAKA
jgi:hypothetical protein